MQALSPSSCLRKIGFLVGLYLTGIAIAHPGDIYEVTASQVTLRAGPSNEATVLTTVQEGDKMVELRQEGSWIGIRVLNTGDEGWIYNELIQLVSKSRLNQRATTTSLEDISKEFVSLMDRVNDHLGYPLVESVEVVENTTLRLTPTQQWLLRTGGDAHVMATLAFYQMWKDHHDGNPVTLMLTDSQGDTYLTIKDKESGPTFSITEPRP